MSILTKPILGSRKKLSFDDFSSIRANSEVPFPSESIGRHFLILILWDRGPGHERKQKHQTG